MKLVSLIRLMAVMGLLCAMAAQASSLIDDGKTTVKYSNYYFKENDGGAVGPNRDEWVQALQLGFSSGWFKDFLGFDYTHALADDLFVGHAATSLTNLAAGSSPRDAHSINKPLEAYLRTQWQDDGKTLTAGYGKKSRRYAIYTDDTTRILPGATMGWDLGFATDALSLRYSRLHAFSPRNATGWGEALENFRGQQVDKLQIYSASYKMPFGTRLLGEFAESQDYLRSGFLQFEQTFPISASQSLAISLTHGQQKDAGKLFEYGGVRGLYEPENSHDARYLDMTMRYNVGGHSVAFNWNKVRGDDFDRLFFAQDHGTWNSSAKLYFWFGLRDEETYKVSSTVDFASLGAPGLKMFSYYALSNQAYGYDGFSRREFQNVFQYSFDGPLKGLSLAWLHDRFHTKGTPDGVHRTMASRGPAGILTEHSERFYLTWQRSF
ncbi:OprD family outer membrane porin [Pseudomonas aeruginosa]